MRLAPKTILTIIPARGGSKGIPRKNLRPLAGKPLLAHSIVQAKRTPSVTQVLVSTDDEEIATVARSWGAEALMRPSEISGDTASSESALLHALDYIKENEGSEPDMVVFLQATSPCRGEGEIQNAIGTMLQENADSLLSVGPMHGFVWRVGNKGSVHSFSYDFLNRPRRQDAPEDLIENGSIYIFKPWVLRKFNNRLGGKIAIHRMSALDSFQIDESGDFELIELLMRHRGVTTSHKEDSGTKIQGNTLRPSSISHLLSSIKLLLLDFDGVLTDNRVLVGQDGKESVLCDRSDGFGIEMLKRAGIEVVVLSKEKNPVVAARCQKLGIECIQGCNAKLSELKQKAKSRKLKPEEVAFVGNDVNDLECLRWVGLPIAVADAISEVRAVAKYITRPPGGHGAVREVCDLLLRTK